MHENGSVGVGNGKVRGIPESDRPGRNQASRATPSVAEFAPGKARSVRVVRREHQMIDFGLSDYRVQKMIPFRFERDF